VCCLGIEDAQQGHRGGGKAWGHQDGVTRRGAGGKWPPRMYALRRPRQEA
jgi:hypothetical protein